MAALSSVYYYKTGTVTVDASGTTVTGSGTSFVAADVRAGDRLTIDGLSAEILEVVSATSLTLILPWAGGAKAGASYVIIKDSPTRFEGAYVAESAREVIASARVIMAGGKTFAVNSYAVNTPPASPITGDTYVVGTSPTGAWAGYAGYLMTWTGTGWEPTTPIQGMQAYAKDTGMSYQRGASAWALSGVDSRQPLDATLTALAGLTTAADQMIYATGVDAFATSGLTAAARAMLAGASVYLTASDDLNTLPEQTGLYSWFNTTAPANAPVTLGVLWQVVRSSTIKFQTIYSGPRTLYRYYASGAWQPWRDYYTPSNVVGTVSQDTSVPNRAMIEFGSNANGSYTRFADGTQICLSPALTVDATLLYDTYFYVPSTPATWTYPAAFSAVPHVTPPTIRTALGGVAGYAGSVGVSSAQAAALCTRSRSGLSMYMSAIGRWY